MVGFKPDLNDNWFPSVLWRCWIHSNEQHTWQQSGYMV